MTRRTLDTHQDDPARVTATSSSRLGCFRSWTSALTRPVWVTRRASHPAAPLAALPFSLTGDSPGRVHTHRARLPRSDRSRRSGVAAIALRQARQRARSRACYAREATLRRASYGAAPPGDRESRGRERSATQPVRRTRGTYAHAGTGGPERARPALCQRSTLRWRRPATSTRTH